MSAETLRKAASLMRERAEAARESAPEYADRWFTAHSLVGDGKTNDDADFIASWHPEVALAVADLLVNEANLIVSVDKYGDLHMPLSGARIDLLLTVARAYLGSES